MKLMYRLMLTSLLVTSTLSMTARADDSGNYGQQPNDDTHTLVKYLLNLGAYFGYDLKTAASQNGVSPSQQLLDEKAITTPQLSLYDTLLGALPVDTVSASLMQFVPNDNNSIYASLNVFANTTFKTPAYETPAAQQGTLSVSNLIDQQNYQQDPVTQAVLNILNTPDSTVCMTNTLDKWVDNCSILNGSLVTENVIGPLPGPTQFYSADYNTKFISQLNSNTLLSPMLYSTSTGGSDTSSSPQPSTQQGLPAQSQLQQAANFIRYATGAVSPLALASAPDYNKIYSAAISTTSDTLTQKKAQATLSTYLASLRIYAAQTSVGFSNLYYILSKRMPQKMLNDQVSSQALSEFTMATWRLFNPQTNAPNKQWAAQIQQASPASVQKEMVMLLAEMNYQLYLNRQQEERMLLTESILLMQGAHFSQPTATSLTDTTSSSQ